MGKEMSRLSRTVSHALRHEPWLYELILNNEGWTSVESMLAALRREREEWADLSENDLARMIDTSNKRRHEIEDGKIRALYGHSIAGKLTMTPTIPPDLLFHGTDIHVVPQIKSSGLLPMGRQYVHLSTDKETAQQVARRKAKQWTILRVIANKAHAHGVSFYEGNEKVWLADEVPTQFIVFEE
jgi:putative RNA 2'-phosphotransferase